MKPVGTETGAWRLGEGCEILLFHRRNLNLWPREAGMKSPESGGDVGRGPPSLKPEGRWGGDKRHTRGKEDKLQEPGRRGQTGRGRQVPMVQRGAGGGEVPREAMAMKAGWSEPRAQEGWGVPCPLFVPRATEPVGAPTGVNSLLLTLLPSMQLSLPSSSRKPPGLPPFSCLGPDLMGAGCVCVQQGPV